MSVRRRQEVLFLYRRLLTLHRHVSPSIKSLGVQYIREEFRRHQRVDLSRVQEFIQQWKAFADKLEEQISRRRAIGENLSDDHLQEFDDGQLNQLAKLRKETSKETGRLE